MTICLNDRQGLQATYESLRLQTVAPVRWIVVDGGSVDGTREWLEGIDWRPLTWTSERDAGIYEAMNKGLAQAVSEYVLFLNSGDMLVAPDDLEAVGNVLAESGERPSLLYGDCFVVDAYGTNYLRRARPPFWVPIGMPTTHQAMYFRANSITGGFDTRYRICGDYAVVAMLYEERRGRDFRRLPRALCRYKLGGRSDQQVDELLRENLEIRRRLLHMDAFRAHVLHVLHRLYGLVKRHLPVLHRLARYG